MTAIKNCCEVSLLTERCRLSQDPGRDFGHGSGLQPAFGASSLENVTILPNRGGGRIRADFPGVAPSVQPEDSVGKRRRNVHGAAVDTHRPGGVLQNGGEFQQRGAVQPVVYVWKWPG